jgi:hypothetical protein
MKFPICSIPLCKCQSCIEHAAIVIYLYSDGHFQILLLIAHIPILKYNFSPCFPLPPLLYSSPVTCVVVVGGTIPAQLLKEAVIDRERNVGRKIVF